MTSEELLKPRYKVIAPYPDSRFEIGDILYRYYFETSDNGMYTYVTNLDSPLQGNSIKKEYVETMPHLFKKLEWWEERKPEEMPEYIKSNDNKAIRPMSELTSAGFRICCIEKWIPVSEQEYLEYINSKNK